MIFAFDNYLCLSLGKWKFGKVLIELWPTLLHKSGYTWPRFWTLGTLRSWATAWSRAVTWNRRRKRGAAGSLLLHSWLQGSQRPDTLSLWNPRPPVCLWAIAGNCGWRSEYPAENKHPFPPSSHTHRFHVHLLWHMSPAYCVFSLNIYIVYLMVTLSVVVIKPTPQKC